MADDLRSRLAEAPRSLRHVRAAQMRARATRWAVGRVLLGSLFDRLDLSAERLA